MSMTFTIFSAKASPSDPPKTVKSCEKTNTRRPSMVPWPVTTPSPYGRFSIMSKFGLRCWTNASSSVKLPGSSRSSIRSRASSLPRARCRSTASGVAASAASMRRRSTASSRSRVVCSGIGESLPERPDPTIHAKSEHAAAGSATIIGAVVGGRVN